jgi:hypothetical protein
MKAKKRKTFSEMREETAEEAAESAWARASQASELRRYFMKKGNARSARTCSHIKVRSLSNSRRILPEEIVETIDDSYQVGLPSVRWKGKGAFHVPFDRV